MSGISFCSLLNDSKSISAKFTIERLAIVVAITAVSSYRSFAIFVYVVPAVTTGKICNAFILPVCQVVLQMFLSFFRPERVNLERHTRPDLVTTSFLAIYLQTMEFKVLIKSVFKDLTRNST